MSSGANDLILTPYLLLTLSGRSGQRRSMSLSVSGGQKRRLWVQRRCHAHGFISSGVVGIAKLLQKVLRERETSVRHAWDNDSPDFHRFQPRRPRQSRSEMKEIPPARILLSAISHRARIRIVLFLGEPFKKKWRNGYIVLETVHFCYIVCPNQSSI